MKQNKLPYLQRKWIQAAYLSICESPEAFGYPSLEGHFDEIVDVIKEDTEQIFNCHIEKEFIINNIDNLLYE